MLQEAIHKYNVASSPAGHTSDAPGRQCKFERDCVKRVSPTHGEQEHQSFCWKWGHQFFIQSPYRFTELVTLLSVSSVLAWRIPGTGEPGGLPSMMSHRVRHDWSDLAAAAAAFSLQYVSIYKVLSVWFHLTLSVIVYGGQSRYPCLTKMHCFPLFTQHFWHSIFSHTEQFSNTSWASTIKFSSNMNQGWHWPCKLKA